MKGARLVACHRATGRERVVGVRANDRMGTDESSYVSGMVGRRWLWTSMYASFAESSDVQEDTLTDLRTGESVRAVLEDENLRPGGDRVPGVLVVAGSTGVTVRSIGGRVEAAQRRASIEHSRQPGRACTGRRATAPRARRCWRSRPPIRRAPSHSRGRSAGASRGPVPGCSFTSIGSWSAGRTGRRGRAGARRPAGVGLGRRQRAVGPPRHLSRRPVHRVQRATRCPRRHRTRRRTASWPMPSMARERPGRLALA